MEMQKTRLDFYRPVPGFTQRIFTKGRPRMPSGPGVVSDDTAFALQVGSRKIPLSPSQAFGLAEDLIRGATRRMIREEADRAAVLDTVRGAEAN